MDNVKSIILFNVKLLLNVEKDVFAVLGIVKGVIGT